MPRLTIRRLMTWIAIIAMILTVIRGMIFLRQAFIDYQSIQRLVGIIS